LFSAERYRFLTDGAVARRPEHPNPSYVRLGAVVYDGFGGFRRSHQQGGFDGGLDVLHASEAWSALYLFSVRIYGNHVIPAPTQFFEELHTEICWVSGDPHYRNTLLGQEILDDLQ